MINSNPGMVMPSQSFCSDEDWLQYAAKFIRGALQFKSQIDDESLEVEVLAGKQLCMTQYYKVFSSCRVPASKRDKLVCYPPNKPNAPRHIVVQHNNQVCTECRALVRCWAQNSGALTSTMMRIY